MALLRFLVCALALTPQVFYWGSDSPFLLTKAVYVYLIGSFACLGLALAGLRQPKPAGLPRSLLALALFVGYAAARAPWLAESRPEISAPFLWGCLLLVAWPTAALATSRTGGIREQANLMVLLGGLTAAYALFQYSGLGVVSAQQAGQIVAASFTPGPGQPPYATFGNPNFLAEYLAFLLPLALLGVLAQGGAVGWLFTGAAVLMGVALPLTLARGSWLAALVGIGVALALRPQGLPAGRRLWKVGWTLVGLVLLVAGAMEYWGRGSGALSKLAWATSQVRSLGEGRRLWWSATLGIVGDHPLVGVGEGRFREVYPAYQARVLARLPNAGGIAVPSASVESPHNDYLQVAADLGIPGLLLLAGVLLLLLWDGVAATVRAGGPERAWRAGCLGGLATVLTAGLFGYPLHTATGLYMTASLASLAVAPPPGPSAPTSAPRWQWWLLAAVTVLGFWQSARLLPVYAASIHLHRGSEAILRRDLETATDMFERAHEVSPRDSLVRMALGRAYLLGQRPDLALPHLQAGLSGFDGAPLRSLLGNAYALVGQDQLAEEMFRTGTRWFPGGYPPLYVSYGRFLAARGRDAEAARELGRALAIDPKLAEAHYLLGHLRAGSGDPAGAVMALRRFLEFAPPGDPREEPTKAFLRRLEGRGPPD